MYFRAKQLLLPLGLIVFAALACNMSTANLKDLKITKDQEGKDSVSKAGPGEKVYAVSQVANNPGKVKVKFNILYDDVPGKKAGDKVEAFGAGDTTLDVDGDRPVYLAITLPPSGMENGRYKVEAKMINDKDEVKDTKSATFTVEGFTAGGD